MNPAVSIVIPVYETAPYLRRCLDSVCGQTLRDIEILCVNDASPDNALAILREYAAKDSRITVLDFLSNRGVSAARNAAIAIARGEYLGFVDSDDAIDAQFYEKLYAKAQDTGAVIVKGARQRVFEDGTKVAQPLNDKVRLSKLTLTYQWTTAIYQTIFIRNNGIICPLRANYVQDTAFLYKAVAVVPGVETVDDAWYCYFERKNSATSRLFDCEATRSYLRSPEDIVSFLNARQVGEEAYDHFFAKAIILCAGRPIKNALPDALGDNARLCAETAIRLYATCLRPAAVDAKLAARMPRMHPFLQAADVTGLTEQILFQKKQTAEQNSAADLRARLRRLPFEKNAYA